MGADANPVVMLGWDAATWDLLTPWVQAGELPNLSRLMAAGSYGPLRSTPLPLSPAAWSTIITGQNPGRHGVFDWFERKPGSYAVEYVNTGRIAAPKIWQYFARGGKRIGVFNLPMVYPAEAVDGFMVSGMAAPNARAAGFAHPADLLVELEATLGPYRVAEAEVFKYGREDAYLQAMLDWLDYQRRAVRFLIERYPCAAYLLVFMQSDHVQHKFWRYQDPDFPGYDPTHDARYRDAILRVYRALDETLGELMDYFGDSATFLLLSDHGAGPAYGVVHLNQWLREEGLLQLRSGAATRAKTWLAKSNVVLRLYRLAARLGLGRIANWVSKPARNKVLSAFLSFDDIDWSRTRAYARGAFGQIFVNLKGREPQGSVEPGEQYQQWVAEIIGKLHRLRHPVTAEPLVSDIQRREEVYQGPYLDRAADVIFSLQNYQYQSSVKLGVESQGLLGESEYEDSGGHRPEGILVMAGPGVRRGGLVEGAMVADVLPTALALADLPIPDGLDGRALSEVFTPEQIARLPVIASPPLDAGRVPMPVETPELAADELAQLEERLRNLGYLG